MVINETKFASYADHNSLRDEGNTIEDVILVLLIKILALAFWLVYLCLRPNGIFQKISLKFRKSFRRYEDFLCQY